MAFRSHICGGDCRNGGLWDIGVVPVGAKAMRRILYWGLLLAMAVPRPSFAAVLAENGKTEYSIAVAVEASPSDTFAAEELKTFLDESTGAKFPVMKDAGGCRTIELGTAAARSLIGEERVAALAEEESVYKVERDKVAICGGGKAGLCYGVYSFLERELGCRWFTTMGDNLVPKHPVLSVPDGVHSEKPRLPYRLLIMFGRANDRDSNDHLFLFRNRINQIGGNYENVLRKDLKGRLPVRMRENLPDGHAFFRYVPPEGKNGYFKNHPEFFSLSKDGKREPRHLCFSNPDLRKTLTTNFLAHAEKVGGKGFLSLSQEDAGGEMCLCDGCRTLSRKYKSTGGPLFDYLFELAPVAKARFPELVIHFLAYHKDSTQPPPAVDSRFPDNLAAVFAPADDDFSKDLSHPNNADTLEDLRNWCRLCKVWLWSYPQVYTVGLPPFGGLGRTAADLKLGIEAGLAGAYVEHDAGVWCGANFTDLQTWLLVQGFRDPTLDWRELRKEFCDFYYGAAAADVIEYEEFLERGRESMQGRLGMFGRSDAFFSSADYAGWERRFDAMERKVGGDLMLVQRLREVRLGLDAVVLTHWKEIARETAGWTFAPDDVYSRATNTYRCAVMRRFTAPSAENLKADFLDGRRGFPKYLSYLRAAHFLSTVTPKALPPELASLPENRIVQIFPTGSSYFNVEYVKLEDAASGFANVERDVQADRRKPPFQFGFYDRTNRKYLISSSIQASEMVPGRFHLYKLGRSAVTSGECHVYMGASWHMNQMCQQMFRPGIDDEWDIYVSLKFEGPDYDSASKLSESSVYFDRLVFVGPFPK